MARDKSRPDRDLEEGEALDSEGTRILSAAFVAHIGKGFSPAAQEKRRLAKPLTRELEEIAAEHPELKRLLAIRLWKIALLGRGKHALEAMRMLMERMDGPVKAEAAKEIGSVTVVQQTYATPAAPQQVEAREVPKKLSVADLPDDEEFAEMVADGRRALRREVRPLPQPSDVIRELDDGRGT